MIYKSLVKGVVRRTVFPADHSLSPLHGILLFLTVNQTRSGQHSVSFRGHCERNALPTAPELPPAWSVNSFLKNTVQRVEAAQIRGKNMTACLWLLSNGALMREVLYL